MIALVSPGRGKPRGMPPGISGAQRQSHFGSRCTTGAEAAAAQRGQGRPSPGLFPAGLRLPQPAQQDCTRSPLRGQQPEIPARVLAPWRSVAIPVSHIWASNKVANATGTKPSSSNPITTLLFPSIAIPHSMHSAMQNEFMVSMSILRYNQSSVTRTLLK